MVRSESAKLQLVNQEFHDVRGTFVDVNRGTGSENPETTYDIHLDTQ